MTKQTAKYYVVWRGRTPGIYSSWLACKDQIDSFEGAQYKSFLSLEEAESAYQKSFYESITKKTSDRKNSGNTSIEANSICVDAACSGNPGVMEYRGVDTKTGKEIFHRGPYREGTNNIGEFLAIVHGIAYLHKSHQNKIIYTDSATAIAWYRKKKANTKLNASPATNALFTLIQRAENYLQHTHHQIEIRKWDTENWGEIPADFGRK